MCDMVPIHFDMFEERHKILHTFVVLHIQSLSTMVKCVFLENYGLNNNIWGSIQYFIIRNCSLNKFLG